MAKRKKAWITENFVLDTCTMSLCSCIPMTSVSWIMCNQSLESIWSSRFAQAQLFCLVLSGSNTRENMKLYGAGTANVQRALLVLFEKEVGFDLISCCIHVLKNTKYIVWGLTQYFQEYILSVFVRDKKRFLCASTQRQFYYSSFHVCSRCGMLSWCMWTFLLESTWSHGIRLCRYTWPFFTITKACKISVDSRVSFVPRCLCVSVNCMLITKRISIKASNKRKSYYSNKWLKPMLPGLRFWREPLVLVWAIF